MLYNLDWLAEGQKFPPDSELPRITTYIANEGFFNNEHWNAKNGSLYYEYVKRITRVIGNASDFICFPVLFNYQRLLALKTADLVCGEYPLITGKNAQDNENLKDTREELEFDTKAYATVIDLCRFGDTVWRMYKANELENKYTFTIWDIKDWFPIVSQDGTLTTTQHVLAWIETRGVKGVETYILHVQIHRDGEFESRNYNVSAPTITNGLYYSSRLIGKMIGFPTFTPTGLKGNAVIHIRNMAVSNTVYGFDDFTPVDSIIAELMTRIAQISKILDKHADPSMTGPPTMLKKNKETGELYFEAGDFYGANAGEQEPKYLVWDGALDASFKQVELLFNQLYILSEMGSALLGAGGSESGQAISGTAMRFKMTNPLAKARRISNLLTLPVKFLFSICAGLEKKNISIVWQDGLPDDPKETIELAKSATGELQIMPVNVAIEEILKRTPEEAQLWIDAIKEVKLKQIEELQKRSEAQQPQTPVNKKTSATGVNNFSRRAIKPDDK